MAACANPSGMVLEWDADFAIRDALRTHGRMLLVEGPKGVPPLALPHGNVIPKTVANMRINKAILEKVMVLMSSTPDLKLPAIEYLIAAVQGLYERNKLDIVTGIYQEAWGIRRLSQLAKSRLYKKSAPKDTHTPTNDPGSLIL